MSLCSAHRTPEPDCRLCQAKPSDLFPDWDEKKAQAESTGMHTCAKCGFVFYKTSCICPMCNHPLEEAR